MAWRFGSWLLPVARGMTVDPMMMLERQRLRHVLQIAALCRELDSARAEKDDRRADDLVEEIVNEARLLAQIDEAMFTISALEEDQS